MHDITQDRQDLQTLRIKELRRLFGDWNNDKLLASSTFVTNMPQPTQQHANTKRLAADVRALIIAALDRLKPPGTLDQTTLHLNDTRWHDALWLPYLVIYGPFFHPMVRTFSIQRLCEQFALSRTHLYRRQNEALMQVLDGLDVLSSRFTSSSLGALVRNTQSAAPACFFGRETELERLCSMLQSDIHTGCRWIGVYGEPGIGKSAFMAALAQQDALRSRYRITAIQVGPDRQPDAVLVDVALALGIGRSIAGADSAAAQIERISAEIADKPTLLLIDDLWNLQQLDLLRQVPAAAVVFSTRQPRLANAELVQQSYRLKGLSESAALEVIQHFSGQLPPDLREICRSLVNTYDCLPLWLQLIGRHMRRVGYDGQHTRVSETLKRLIANARLRLDLGSEAQASSMASTQVHVCHGGW